MFASLQQTTQRLEPYLATQGTTREIHLDLRDPQNNIVPNNALSTMTLSLYMAANVQQIINNRDKQDVLGVGSGANNVTVDSQGHVVWYMQTADNAVVANTAENMFEQHEAQLVWQQDPQDGNGLRTNVVHIPIWVLAKRQMAA